MSIRFGLRSQSQNDLLNLIEEYTMSERRFDPSNMAKLDNPERHKALPPEGILSSLVDGYNLCFRR